MPEGHRKAVETGATSEVLKNSKNCNFGSLFGAALTPWRQLESFMELPDRKECHLVRRSVPDLILA